jgi:integrase/recombinase XerD
VTEARASAQRAKLDAQAEARRRTAEDAARARPSAAKRERDRPGNRREATVERAIADYLLDHVGGNHSAKTLEWHRTALGLMRAYLEEECKITLVQDIDAPDLNGWLAHLRTTPGSRGKPRSERTIQTYARSALAFFHWLVRRELTARNPFERVTFPKVGKPLIQTIDADEFARLLLACTPPHECGRIADRSPRMGSPCSLSAFVNGQASPRSASARTFFAIPSPFATWCWAMTHLACRNCWGMRI